MLLAALLAGCSGGGSSPEALLAPAQDALSAVSSAVVALDLLNQGRSTNALTEVVFRSGVDQLAADEQTVVKLSVSSNSQRPDRDAVLAAIRRAATAEMNARDALTLTSSPQSPQAAGDRLKAAAQDLTTITARLQATR